ncbi:outer membrane protein assembly factor BamA [Terasakiispira papahanaumokuakeensis]|uniref:Outer membrane protein assembly factor BamA n=1 Tax=Terasakiispira papahanaumokuakeensis TaxID=197479 RepID=A0A1E2VBK0_9GAMM|nr:outer membrane protein assembly factor BamA [Terasakiispira papahanaumokuakeensis]ODC04242.1 outer membrane protein assembly factor BamA [Terasakiispira papahanaumokuakeensis]
MEALSVKSSGLLPWCLALLCAASVQANAETQDFKVSDIRVEGLQRVSAGTVFAELPLRVGQTVDTQALSDAAKKVFKSGLFDDLKLARDHDVLIVKVQERPMLSALDIEGNQKVSTDDLKAGLKQTGLEEGQVFRRSTLEKIQLELERMYHAQGRYNASITTDVEKMPRNQVKVSIQINEGTVATIKRINIVGNHAFDNDTLLGRFELEEDSPWSLFSSADQYSREKLTGDLEKLRSWYLDRGYLRFSIESTQVSISPDKQDIYITVNVHEGDRYKVSQVDLAGDLILDKSKLEPLIALQAGQTFSRSLMTASSEAIRQRLGAEGYTYANVNGAPNIDDEKKEVAIRFVVDPGRRHYVRQISFRGNVTTQDEVLRREMTQMEGGWASTDKIQQSKANLERLGYFKTVNVETHKVPGRSDQIDVDYNVEEQASGSISASVGYSQSSGIIYGAQLSQRNFLGTGNTVSVGANKSDYRTSYNFNYYNPYYTIDGISRGYDVFYRKTNYDETDVSNFATDTYGANVTYGYPISNDTRLSLSLGFDETRIRAEEIGGAIAVQEITEFTDEYGDDFWAWKATGRWTQNRLNKGVLATAGSYQTVSLEVAVPGSDYTFYKLNYRGQKYFPIAQDWSLKFRTDLGYGAGFGDYKRLPFYENYYSGGLGSVRGYESNTLGPRGTPSAAARADGEDGDPFGGNILAEGSIELIFPLPFVEDQSSMQTTLFLDGGTVFSDDCYDVSTDCSSGISGDELRFSTGIGLTWLTALGPLTFSVAKALNPDDEDETQFFQFSLGQTF